MPITFHGVAASPADNGTSVATQITLTPPGSMTAGDLVFVTLYQRGTATFSVGVDGGQTWSSLGRSTGSNIATEAFWCVYDGTWDADPRFDFSAGTNTNAVMLVFRPSDTGKTWAIDVGPSAAAFAAPTTPFTVTITGLTTTQGSTVTIASWVTADDNTWGSLSGTAWSKTGLAAQYRNTSGSDMSSTYAYNIQTSAGTTSDVSQNQATLGGDAGRRLIVSFYEYTPTTNHSFDALPGTITVAGQVAGATRARTFDALAGAITIAGQIATSGRGKFLNALPGAITIAGQVAGATRARSISILPGTITIAGQVAGATRARSISILPGAITIAGQIATSGRGKYVNALPGTITIAGQVAGATRARTFDALAGAITIAGQVAGMTRARLIAILPGTITLAGQIIDVTLDVGSVTNYSFDALPGTITVAGQVAGVSRARVIEALPGEIVIAGQVIGIIKSWEEQRIVMALSGGGIETALLMASIILPPAALAGGIDTVESAAGEIDTSADLISTITT